MDFPDEVLSELRIEREILTDGGLPALKMILAKLDEAADRMAREYDAIDYAREPEKAIRVQMFRRIAKVEIPNIVEKLISIDRPADVPKFNFWTWIKSISKE